MSRHRNTGEFARAPLGLDEATSIPAPIPMPRRTGQGTRGRIVIAAVAAGAFAAAGAGQLLHAVPAHGDEDVNTAALKQKLTGSAARTAMGGDQSLSPDVLLTAHEANPVDEAKQMATSQHAIQVAAAARAEAQRPKYVKPADGTFTSGFEPRWGSFHYGIDLAASKDTPIVAAADGEIIEAGPASGFGLWVREQLSDGTILVYGHMDDFSVHEGQHVKAGEQIARVGNRGEATGYHLHFEVWDPSGKKIDPQPWLADRGIDV